MRLLALLLFGLMALTAGETTPPGTGTGAAIAPVERSAGTTTAAATIKVGYLPIDGEINPSRAAYFTRGLKEAQAAGITHLVVHLSTPGGRVDSAMEMLQAALTIPKDRPRLIAFVDTHALSAGSLIAYGHDEVLLTPTSVVGDIGVIMQKQDGTIEYAPEKMETVVRALLRNVAQNRGWDEARLQKMTARNQELYRFDLPPAAGGATRATFVIEDDLGSFLSAHPEVRSEQKILVLGKDRLISYTAQEAVAQGMATALVPDLDGVYARLGTTRGQVTDLSPSSTERTAWALSGFAPLLIAAAILFVFLEFKMPMGGLWLGLGAVAGVAFFVCQFYLEMATYLEVVLVLLGLALVVVEVLVVPFAGLFAVLGGLLVASGIVLSFLKSGVAFNPSADGWGEAMGYAFRQSALALGALSAGAVVLISTLPRVALRTGLADAAAIRGTSSGAIEEQAVTLTGRSGIARSDLRPGGTVEVDGRAYSAVSATGDFIAAAAPVVVVGARFGELSVRRKEEPA